MSSLRLVARRRGGRCWSWFSALGIGDMGLVLVGFGGLVSRVWDDKGMGWVLDGFWVGFLVNFERCWLGF